MALLTAATVETTFTTFRSRAMMTAAAAPLPADDDLIRKIYAPSYVCRVELCSGVWVVALHEPSVRATLSRNALRFVPFNFKGAEHPIREIARRDPYNEMREIGRSCLPETLVYTPPLWLLLNTDPESTTPEWFEAVVPVHYLFYWYRTVMMFLVYADYQSSLYDEMVDLSPPQWVTEPDMKRAHALWAEARETNRRQADRDVSRQMCLQSRSTALEVWRRVRSPADAEADAVTADAKEYTPKRLVTLMFEDIPPSAEVYAVWLTHATPDADATKQMEAAYTEFSARVQEDTLERPLTSEEFQDLRVQTAYAIRQKKKQVDQMREKRAEMQKQYEEQTETMLRRYDALAARHLADLRANHAKERLAMNLHVYAVNMINVVEDVLMGLIGVPTNLRQAFHTQLSPPDARHIPAGVTDQCDFLASEVVKAAARKRAEGGEALARGWVLPPRVPDAALAACTTADAYSEILLSLLDTWPAETQAEAAVASTPAPDPDE